MTEQEPRLTKNELVSLVERAKFVRYGQSDQFHVHESVERQEEGTPYEANPKIDARTTTTSYIGTADRDRAIQIRVTHKQLEFYLGFNEPEIVNFYRIEALHGSIPSPGYEVIGECTSRGGKVKQAYDLVHKRKLSEMQRQHQEDETKRQDFLNSDLRFIRERILKSSEGSE